MGRSTGEEKEEGVLEALQVEIANNKGHLQGFMET